MLGLPALVAPHGLSKGGLPIGIQLVGPAWSDTRLLAIAKALETADILPGYQPPPDRLEYSRAGSGPQLDARSHEVA